VRVAAGAIAKKWLHERYGVTVRGYLAQLGAQKISFKSWDSVDANPFFSPDPAVVPQLETFMDRLRESGDSCGARVNVVAENVPVGWGSRCMDGWTPTSRGDDVHHAVKGVEIGAGFRVHRAEGKRARRRNDAARLCFPTTMAGCWAASRPARTSPYRSALKPTSSIRLPRRTINTRGEAVTVETTGRHDPCVGIRATPIAEAMLACILMDHALRHRAQCADVILPSKLEKPRKIN